MQSLSGKPGYEVRGDESQGAVSKLPDDVARCGPSRTCPQCYSCQRVLEHGGPNTPYIDFSLPMSSGSKTCVFYRGNGS